MSEIAGNNNTVLYTNTLRTKLFSPPKYCTGVMHREKLRRPIYISIMKVPALWPVLRLGCKNYNSKFHTQNIFQCLDFRDVGSVKLLLIILCKMINNPALTHYNSAAFFIPSCGARVKNNTSKKEIKKIFNFLHNKYSTGNIGRTSN